MKTFAKFLGSLSVMPFLIPWYLADKTYEYLFQPATFRRHNLEIAKHKLWIYRIAKYLPLLFLGLYFLYTGKTVWENNAGFSGVTGGIKLFFMLAFNDLANLLNTLLIPVNKMFYLLQGGKLPLFDVFEAFYFCIFAAIFLTNLSFQMLKTRSSLKQAVQLRNKAVREVDIVHFSEEAEADSIFMGLDQKRLGRPLYAKRKWLKGHLQVIGGPGSGKTESIIQPLWYQEVRRNVATFVLDGKGSSRNIDRFYTIASSMAQWQDIYYFNPADPARSDSYNPLLRGSAGDVKEKIMASLNWAEHTPATRQQLDRALEIFLRAIEENHWFFSLRELLQYFESKDYLRKQQQKASDPFVKNGIEDIISRFHHFQTETAFFIVILRDLFQSGYGQLLNTDKPDIDVMGIYFGRRDCYFTLPMHTNERASRFLGQLILQDIRFCLQQSMAHNAEEDATREGLLIIDEMAKFANPDFIRVMQTCRNAGVSICYTNQSIGEMEDPALNLSHAFLDRLAEQTNGVCCFQLGSPESIEHMLRRFNAAGKNGNGETTDDEIDPATLRNLEVGQCVVFFRQPHYLSTLKTGYFKFDQLLRFSGQRDTAPDGEVSSDVTDLSYDPVKNI